MLQVLIDTLGAISLATATIWAWVRAGRPKDRTRPARRCLGVELADLIIALLCCGVLLFLAAQHV